MFAAIVFAVSINGGMAATCAAAARDVAAGEHVSANMLTPVACGNERRQRRLLRFDRVTRTFVAAQALAAGTYLGKLYPPAASLLPKGSKLTLRSTSGPAVIERQVVTLQPARSGRRVFVRDSAGNVFAVVAAFSNGGSTAP